MCWCWVAVDSSKKKTSANDRNAFSWLTFQSHFLSPSPSEAWVTMSMHAQNIHWLSLPHMLLHACLCGKIKCPNMFFNKHRRNLSLLWRLLWKSSAGKPSASPATVNLSHLLQLEKACLGRGRWNETRSEINVWFSWVCYGDKNVIFKEILFTFLLSKWHD